MDARFIRHFQHFLVVAEELHFGRAAALLGMSQPPLSQRIRRLEEELGVTLFTRTKHAVELTYAGKLLLERVRRILRDAEIAKRVVKQAAQGETGRLEIAFTTSADFSVVPMVLPHFKRRFPDISLELHVMHGPQQLEALRQKAISVGIMRLPAGAIDADIAVDAVLREPLVAVLSEGHPLAARERVALRDVLVQPFIFFPRDVAPGYHDYVMSRCSREGIAPLIVQHTDSVHTTVSLIAAGLGVSLQPASVRRLQRAGVVFRELEGAPLRVAIGIAYRKDNTSQVLRNFIDVAREYAGAAPEEGDQEAYDD